MPKAAELWGSKITPLKKEKKIKEHVLIRA